jgi:hypothetical protein
MMARKVSLKEARSEYAVCKQNWNSVDNRVASPTASTGDDVARDLERLMTHRADDTSQIRGR